jgi:hypothetical protein
MTGRATSCQSFVTFIAIWALACFTMFSRASAEEEAMFADVVDVVVAAPPAAVPALPDAQMQQFRAQFEPMLRVELSLINRVCKPAPDERRALIAKCNAWLDTFIRDYAKKGGQPNVDGAWFGGPMANMQNPRESFAEALKPVVQKELSDEKYEQYEDECRQRAEFEEFEKSVAVENLVAKMDGELMLSPEQREKLTDSLSSHWQKSWAPQLEMFAFGMDIWPNVPDQWVRPHLTAAQQVAWSRLNKQSGQMFFGGQFFGMAGQVIDDIDLDEGRDKKDDAADDKAAAAEEELRHRLGVQRASN